MSQEKGQTRPVEEEVADDPTRHEEDVMPPPDEAHGDQRRKQVAGKDQDVSDKETYEGGPGW